MNTKEAIADVNFIVDQFLSGQRDQNDELNKQILIALIFGAMNRYAEIKADIQPSDLQALLIYVLIQRFSYNEENAGSYSSYLVQCTDKYFHPVIYSLIVNGMSLYDVVDNTDLLNDQIKKIISIVKN